MSIKRTKQRSFTRNRGGEGTDFSFLSAPAQEASWVEHVKDQADTLFKPYRMSDTFSKGDFILHPKFGKGLVASIEDVHIVVLFEDGKKKLGHGR
jgi:hypothetical protein